MLNISQMKKLPLTLLILTLFAFRQIAAQTGPATPVPKEPSFGIRFSGYVNSDIFFDTRQTVMAREGQWLFYPENIRKDTDGNDINARGTYSILSIQTRLSGNITGPDVFGAKTTGLIEGEFYGSANLSINTLRLRHAWVKLAWPKTELQIGQNWHPLYVPAAAPEPVSLNSGAPFIVFARNPQVRLTRQIGDFKVLGAVLFQLDQTSNGPEGPSPKYLRNSIVPEMVVQVQYGRNGEGRVKEFLAAAGLDYLLLMPRLSTEVTIRGAYDTVVNNLVVHHNAVVQTYKTEARVPALSGNLLVKMKFAKWTAKFGGLYGANCYAFSMIGGYAVKGITDPLRGTVEYAATRTASAWADLKTNGPRWSFGVYGGYSKNLGASSELAGPYYSRGENIDYLYRVAPRIVLTVNKLKIATEVDYTVAAYGTVTGKGMVADPVEVGNVRFLCGVNYYF